MSFKRIETTKIDQKLTLKKMFRIFKELDNALATHDVKVELHFRDYFTYFTHYDADGNSLSNFIEGDYIKLFRDFTNENEFTINVKTDDAKKKLKVDKLVKEVLKRELTKLNNELAAGLAETDDYLNFVYVYNNQTCVVKNGLIKRLFYTPDGDGIEEPDTEKKQVENEIMQLLKDLVNTKDIVTFQNERNVNNFRLIDYINDASNMHRFLLAKIKGIVRIIADFTNVLGSRVPSDLSNLPITVSGSGFLNDYMKPDETIISYLNTINNTESRRYYTTVFDNKETQTTPCFISNLPIITSKHIDLRVAKGHSHMVAIDETGRLCFMKFFKEWQLSNKYGCKTKRNEDGTLIYIFSDKHEANYKKLKNENKTYFESIHSYGSRLRHEVFLNKDDSRAFKPDELYLGAELEFDHGGRESENNALYLAALTGYDLIAWSTFDSSVSRGFESKTVPTVIEKHLDENYLNYSKAFELLKLMGYRAGESDTCGLHVHISSSFFTHPYRNNGRLYARDVAMTMFGSILERNWHKIAEFTRRTPDNLDRWATNPRYFTRNSGAQNMLVTSKNLSDINYKMKELTDYYSGKHGSINNSRGTTFELRIFKGTINEIAYKATLQFVNNLALIVKECVDLVYEQINNMDDNKLERPLDGLIKAFSVSYDDIISYKRYPELDAYASDINSYRKD